MLSWLLSLEFLFDPVTVVIESGLITIITGLPSWSSARTMKELGINWMFLNPAFSRLLLICCAIFPPRCRFCP